MCRRLSCASSSHSHTGGRDLRNKQTENINSQEPKSHQSCQALSCDPRALPRFQPTKSSQCILPRCEIHWRTLATLRRVDFRSRPKASRGSGATPEGPGQRFAATARGPPHKDRNTTRSLDAATATPIRMECSADVLVVWFCWTDGAGVPNSLLPGILQRKGVTTLTFV